MNRKAMQGLALAGAIIASAGFDMESLWNREDISKARKERKERARMLTAQRMAEIQAQGGTRKRKKKRK